MAYSMGDAATVPALARAFVGWRYLFRRHG